MLHNKLLSFGKPCGFLHVNSPSSQSPHVSTKSLLPPIPRSIKEKVLVKMRGLDHPLNINDISSLGEYYLRQITLTKQQIDAIERATQKQFACRRWHEERYCRITSSI